MGYKQTIEANGVTVKRFEQFGSYQGTWLAILTDGRVIEGSYGSCSGCDSFEAEFGCSNLEPEIRDGKYYRNGETWYEENECTLEEFEEAKLAYLDKLKQFGKSYLNSAESFDDIISRYQIKVDDEYAWEDDKEILQWLLDNKPV